MLFCHTYLKLRWATCIENSLLTLSARRSKDVRLKCVNGGEIEWTMVPGRPSREPTGHHIGTEDARTHPDRFMRRTGTYEQSFHTVLPFLGERREYDRIRRVQRISNHPTHHPLVDGRVRRRHHVGLRGEVPRDQVRHRGRIGRHRPHALSSPDRAAHPVGSDGGPGREGVEPHLAGAVRAVDLDRPLRHAREV